MHNPKINGVMNGGCSCENKSVRICVFVSEVRQGNFWWRERNDDDSVNIYSSFIGHSRKVIGKNVAVGQLQRALMNGEISV